LAVQHIPRYNQVIRDCQISAYCRTFAYRRVLPINISRGAKVNANKKPAP
jgi:hypothetical protein